MSVADGAKRRRFRPDEIKGRVAAVERAAARGSTIAAACAAASVSIATFYRWKRDLEAGTSTLPPSRPSDITRETVLQAARSVFLREGFGASLGKVALASGVTRQTIYNIFGTRDRLFGEVVQSLYQKLVAPVLVLGADSDLVSVLEECGRHQIRFSLDPEAIGLMRITLGEYRDHPELASVAYAMRSGRNASNIANVVAAQLVTEMDRGTIDTVDPHFASEAFLGSCTAYLRHRALIGLPPAPAEEQEARLQLSVRLFVRGLGYKPAH